MSATPSTSASTSTATSPEEFTRDVTKKLLKSAEKTVYRAIKAITTQSKQEPGVLPRGKFKQLMVAHGYKNWSNLKIQAGKFKPLQPATGEPRTVKTPKIHVKRQRYQLSTDSDDPDASPDPDWTINTMIRPPRERKKSKVQAMVNRIESSGDEQYSPPKRPRTRRPSRRLRRPSQQQAPASERS